MANYREPKPFYYPNTLVMTRQPTTMGSLGSAGLGSLGDDSWLSAAGQAVGAGLTFWGQQQQQQQQQQAAAAAAAAAAGQQQGGIDMSTILIGAVLLGGGYLIYKKMKKKR